MGLDPASIAAAIEAAKAVAAAAASKVGEVGAAAAAKVGEAGVGKTAAGLTEKGVEAAAGDITKSTAVQTAAEIGKAKNVLLAAGAGADAAQAGRGEQAARQGNVSEAQVRTQAASEGRQPTSKELRKAKDIDKSRIAPEGVRPATPNPAGTSTPPELLPDILPRQGPQQQLPHVGMQGKGRSALGKAGDFIKENKGPLFGLGALAAGPAFSALFAPESPAQPQTPRLGTTATRGKRRLRRGPSTRLTPGLGNVPSGRTQSGGFRGSGPGVTALLGG